MLYVHFSEAKIRCNSLKSSAPLSYWLPDLVPGAAAANPATSLEAKVGGRGSLAARYSAHKKAQSRPSFGLLRASVLSSYREEKQLVL